MTVVFKEEVHKCQLNLVTNVEWLESMYVYAVFTGNCNKQRKQEVLSLSGLSIIIFHFYPFYNHFFCIQISIITVSCGVKVMLLIMNHCQMYMKG